MSTLIAYDRADENKVRSIDLAQKNQSKKDFQLGSFLGKLKRIITIEKNIKERKAQERSKAFFTQKK